MFSYKLHLADGDEIGALEESVSKGAKLAFNGHERHPPQLRVERAEVGFVAAWPRVPNPNQRPELVSPRQVEQPRKSLHIRQFGTVADTRLHPA